MRYSRSLLTSPSRVCMGTPRQRVPSFDQRVTQWMSVVMSSAGTACISAQFHDLSTRPSCRIEKVHSLRGVCGVGPADSTGKPFAMYWPGGTRSCASAGRKWRPRKPRDTGLMAVLRSDVVPEHHSQVPGAVAGYRHG